MEVGIMTLRLTRVELTDVLCWERLSVDLGQRTIVSGRNGRGKSCFIRAVECICGISGESAAALVRTDEQGKPVDGAVPELIGIIEDEGARFQIRRRAKKLDVKVWDAQLESWRDAEGTADQALNRIFDRDSSPQALLDAPTDDKRLTLILEVAEAVGYSRIQCLAKAFEGAEDAGCGAFKLQPIPDGLHPLEDLSRVVKQVFDVRTDVERTRKAAASAADRLATGLTAEAPEDVSGKVLESQAAVDRLKDALSKMAGDLNQRIAVAREAAEAQISQIRSDLHVTVETMRAVEHDLAEETQQALLRATRELAELRTTQEIVVADKSRRDESEKARAEAQALAARHAALTKAINSLKAQAAQFVSDSFPGVSVEVSEEGKRALMVETDAGWKPWSGANEAKLHEIAGAWAVKHQEKRGGAGDSPELLLVLMDRGETLDPTTEARLLGSLSARGQVILTKVSAGELKFEVAP